MHLKILEGRNKDLIYNVGWRVKEILLSYKKWKKDSFKQVIV